MNIAFSSGSSSNIVSSGSSGSIVSNSNNLGIHKQSSIPKVLSNDCTNANIHVETRADTIMLPSNYNIVEDEDSMVYSKRVDFISDAELYRGEASVGADTSAPVWRIRKISISPIDSDVVEIWADGVSLFSKIWDNRLNYQYI